uniref:Gamma-glutamyltransferase n=1 Tax=Ciona savignyi TaxID=51511 RepID=H2ZHA5_CIOSA
MNGNYLRVSNDSDEDVVELQLVAQQTKVNGRVSFYQNNPINFWNTECICRLISLFILFLIAIGFGISRFPVHSFHSHNHAEEHHLFKHAAVAAGQKECSDIGKEVLKDGGNAVDAAIAHAVVPRSSGAILLRHRWRILHDHLQPEHKVFHDNRCEGNRPEQRNLGHVRHPQFHIWWFVGCCTRGTKRI